MTPHFRVIAIYVNIGGIGREMFQVQQRASIEGSWCDVGEAFFSLDNAETYMTFLADRPKEISCTPR